LSQKCRSSPAISQPATRSDGEGQLEGKPSSGLVRDEPELAL